MWVPIFLSLFPLGLYVYFRCLDLTQVRYQRYPDTDTFALVSSFPLWSRGFLAGDRPFVVPLCYKIFHGDHPRLIQFQILASTLCWGLLAFSAAWQARNAWFRPLIVLVVLAFGLHPNITAWDGDLLSESLSFSLTALLIAVFLFLLDAWTWTRIIGVILAGLLWAFCRDTNAFLLLPLSVFLAITAVSSRTGKCLTLSLAFLVGFLFSNISADLGRRWCEPLLNVFSQRILADPVSRDFFARRGMPVNDALMNRAGKWKHSDDYAYYKDPDLAAFRTWYFKHGKSCYVQFLLSHPVAAIRDVCRNRDDLLSIGPPYYYHTGYTAPYARWVRLFFPAGSWTLLIWLGGVLTAGCLLWGDMPVCPHGSCHSC